MILFQLILLNIKKDKNNIGKGENGFTGTYGIHFIFRCLF